MKMKTSLLALAALGLSANALADVTISIPDTVTVLVTNQQKPDIDGSLFTSHKSVTLPDGDNQIVFVYKPYFNQGNDRIIVESEPIVAKFTAQNNDLTFDLPKYRNVHEAKQEIKSVTWQLKDKNGQSIAIKQDQLIKEGMQIGRDFVQEVTEYNRHNGVASLNNAAVPATLPAVTFKPEVGTKQDMTADNTAEQMLHFWYQKADANTQARFKQFILEN